MITGGEASVVKLDRSPFGQLLYEPDRLQAVTALQQAGQFAQLDGDAVQLALQCLAVARHSA